MRVIIAVVCSQLYELQMMIATCQFLDLLTPVATILLSIKRNKMLNIKIKFDTFQIPGKEGFSKRTNIRSWEGHNHAKILTKPISSNKIYVVHFDT